MKLINKKKNEYIKEIFKKRWELKQSMGKKMPTAGAQFKVLLLIYNYIYKYLYILYYLY